MKAVLTAVLLVLGLAWSLGSAEAATNQARNRCFDAIRILRSNPSMRDVSVPLDPLTVENASRHWDQVIDGWNRASAQINLIPKAELDEKDPELAECFTEVRKWGAYIKALDGRIKEAHARAKTVVPFLAAVKPMQASLWPLVAVHYGQGDVTSNSSPAKAGAMMEVLGKIEGTCTQMVPTAGATMPALRNAGAGAVRNTGGIAIPASFEDDPDVWCFVAKNRKALITTALSERSFHVPGFGNHARDFPSTLTSLGEGRTGMAVWVAMVLADPAPFKAAMLSEIKAWYTAVGVDVPAAPIAKMEATLVALRTAAEAAFPAARFDDTKLHDKRIEAIGRATIKKHEPSSKILASAMDQKDFTISKNRFDLPTDRFRSGHVLMKRPKAPWCEERTFSYVETYQGGGKFARSTTGSVTEGTRLVRCP